MENVLELYLMLYRIEQKVRREISEIINNAAYELTFDQWLTLRIIVDRRNGILQSELAKLTSKDKAAVHRICKILKQKSYVISKPTFDNLLHINFLPTKLGENCVKELAASIQLYNKDFNREYFDREYYALVNLIQRMLP
jgi:DNA-binding MarR family transcriptional regulator